MNEFKTPRFVLAAFFSLTTTAAYLFTEKMDSNQYTVVMSVILSLYGAIAITQGVRQRKKDRSDDEFI